MIRKTLFPKGQSYIPAASKSFRFSGGTASVQLDSLGNYEVIVNGDRYSPYENSAKRDPGYKRCIAAVTADMVSAFEKRDASYIAMHKKALRMQKLAEHQSKIDALAPLKYARETCAVPRPRREDIRHELETEATIRFADLYVDKQKERVAYVNEHEKEVMAARLRAFEEVQAFFSELEDDKETKANAKFQSAYEAQVKEIENYINGEQKATDAKIEQILGELTIPFRVDVSCQYDEASGKLTTEIEMDGSMSFPTNKVNTLASGKISVKDMLVKEKTQFMTDTVISLIYYIAASLFNAAIGIKIQEVSVWLKGKSEGLAWIQFDRKGFGKLSMRTVNPTINYYEWPHADALAVVRGASQFNPMDTKSFKNAISQAMLDGGINIEDNETSVIESDSSIITVSIEYAKIIANSLPNDTVIQSLVKDAENSGLSKVTILR